MDKLGDLFKKKQQSKDEEAVNWERIREEWRDDLAKLTAKLDGWLGGAKEAGLLATTTQEFVSEYLLGTYLAPVLTLRFGSETATVRPKGRNSLGGGRVDFESQRFGDVQVILLFPPAEGGAAREWEIVYNRPRTRTAPKREPLNAETFGKLVAMAFGLS